MNKYEIDTAKRNLGIHIKNMSDISTEILHYWVAYAKCETRIPNIEAAIMLSHDLMEVATTLSFIHYYRLLEDKKYEKIYRDTYMEQMKSIGERLKNSDAHI